MFHGFCIWSCVFGLNMYQECFESCQNEFMRDHWRTDSSRTTLSIPWNFHNFWICLQMINPYLWFGLSLFNFQRKKLKFIVLEVYLQKIQLIFVWPYLVSKYYIHCLLDLFSFQKIQFLVFLRLFSLQKIHFIVSELIHILKQ